MFAESSTAAGLRLSRQLPGDLGRGSTVRILTPTIIGAAAVLANVSPATASTPAHIQPAAHPVFRDCAFTSNRFIVHHKENGKETVVETHGITISGIGNVNLGPNPGPLDITRGTATGKIERDAWVNFTVTPNYPGAKSEEYQGSIIHDDGPLNGSVTGTAGVVVNHTFQAPTHWTAPPDR